MRLPIAGGLPQDQRSVGIPEELQRTVASVMDRLAADAETIEAQVDTTIMPRELRVDARADRAIELLAGLDGARTLSRRLELHGTIGEGGMGIVRLGTQRTLSRPVAVKTLREEVKSERSTIKLLREAWVTGSLEHPNVVPVYDVALEADGSPLIVLKKIEGTGWEALMHDAQTVRERFREEDMLEWNLRILLQVCNAIHFAHSRGIIHRDLKPENVMVGEFGEVYVVDWGIALSLRDDGSGRLPLARDATDMAGTPVYMAPEMLGGPTSRLSEQTDVYLLGALLYEIVVGRPPHRGETLMELVLEIVDSNPEIPDTVPTELRAVIRHAMDADPNGRFETADQFRIALRGFLQHRDAIALASKAEQQLDKLEALLAQEADDGGGRDLVYPLFGDARFGFLHALEVWPGCEAARDGLDRALARMIEFELQGGEPEAARTLLSQLSDPPTALTQKVEEARDRRRAEDRSLRALKDDTDPAVGRRTRVFLALIIGAIWCISPLGEQLWISYGNAPSHAAATVLLGSVMVMLLALGYWARESLQKTRINRFLTAVVVLAMGSGLLAHALGWVAGDANVLVTARDQFLTWGVLAAAAAQNVDRRLLIPAAGYAGGYASLVFFPTALLPLLVLCNAIMMGTMVRLWFQRGDIEALNERSKERRRARHRWLRGQPTGSEEAGDDVVEPRP